MKYRTVCPKCQGQGGGEKRITLDFADSVYKDQVEYVECKRCHGEGRINLLKEACMTLALYAATCITGLTAMFLGLGGPLKIIDISPVISGVAYVVAVFAFLSIGWNLPKVQKAFTLVKTYLTEDRKGSSDS